MKKTDEALHVLKKMARINKMNFEFNTLDDYIASEKLLFKPKNESTISEICIPRIRFFKIFILFILWNSLSMNYVGVSLGITSVMNINPYIMFSLSSFFEFVGAAICHFNQK